jgi:hypothetical protein
VDDIEDVVTSVNAELKKAAAVLAKSSVRPKPAGMSHDLVPPCRVFPCLPPPLTAGPAERARSR